MRIKNKLNNIVINPMDNDTEYFITLGIHAIGVVPKSDITDNATPNDIINNPIINII